MDDNTLAGASALVTGGARRIGAAIVRRLHAAGLNLNLHFRHSEAEAEALAAELQRQRPDSVQLLEADLRDTAALPRLVERAAQRWGRLDLLVNNASAFYPTPLESTTEAQWEDLLGSNLKAPFFLVQAAAPWLRAMRGSVVNIADIHAERPRAGHPVYSAAKAGLVALTRSLAWELRPAVRVNAVAPGAILWAEQDDDPAARQAILERIPLDRLGTPDDIARAVLFLARDTDYVTGQVLAIDGGRSLFM
ncbi:MAG: pteridine reductase [Candidatus Competibacterales bacterium]|nr:pteridine reductase [Candidatus Competibacterales bacterium]